MMARVRTTVVELQISLIFLEKNKEKKRMGKAKEEQMWNIP